MAAPKGNQFWKLRSRHGRDLLFVTPELLWEAACEYFNWVDAHPWFKIEQLKTPVIETNKETGEKKITAVTKVPTARPYSLSGFCLYAHASENFWKEFRKNENLSEDFLAVIARVEEIISTQQFEGASVGAFNANIISRKLGLSDKQEMTGKDGGPIQHDHKFKITLNLNK